MQFHPDKNRAPGADEAFKTISRSFGVLSDPAKKKQYDRFGSDSNIPQGGRSGFPGGFGGPQFEADISPEDLFRMFFDGFGSGGGGMPGGAHFFSFGGHPGAQQFFSMPRRRREPPPQQARPQHRGPASDFDRLRSIVSQLLPVILFFAFSILTSWLNSWSSSGPAKPTTFDEIADLVSLTPGLGFPFARQTMNLNVPYFATRSYQDAFKDTSSTSKDKRQLTKLKGYEDVIEKTFVKDLQRRCKAETNEQEAKVRAAKDSGEMSRLKAQKLPSCDRLHSLGLK
jgi:DnaJ family protein B protein 12